MGIPGAEALYSDVNKQNEAVTECKFCNSPFVFAVIDLSAGGSLPSERVYIDHPDKTP